MSLEVHCCKTCGNLWKQGGSSDLLEYAGEDYRNNGQADWNARNPHPRCHKQVDLKGEWETAIETFGGDNNANRKAAVAVMHLPRPDCKYWREFYPNKNPNEHDEMDFRQLGLNIQQQLFAWRQEQAETNQKWEKQIQALSQIRHNESIDVAKQEVRGTNWQAIGTILAFIVAALSLAVSVAAYLKN